MPQGDKAELILHIGGAKCGSSAIQASLKRNAEALAGQGILVPGKLLDLISEVTGEQIWAFEDAALGGLEGEPLGLRLNKLFEVAAKKNARKLILSAENICNHPSLAASLRRASDGRRVKVVFYVRRQDDFLISSWQQWHLKLFDSVEAFLTNRVGRVACWYSMITPWADAFGDENVIVRPFQRDQLIKHDVVADFFEQIGVSQTGLSPLGHQENPSFDDALARLAHRVRDVFDDQHDNRFYQTMVGLLGAKALKSGSASSLLALDTRLRILARYESENEALKTRFLPERGDAPLFRLPSSKDVVATSEDAKLSDDIAMLTRCVYALADRSDNRS